MKKFTAFALCFVLTASLLTACRSKAPEETNSPTNSATTPATTNGSMDATGGNDSGTARNGRGPMEMPMG